MMRSHGVEESEEGSKSKQAPKEEHHSSEAAAADKKEKEPSDSRLKQYGEYLYSYLPGLPTFFQSKSSEPVSKSQDSPKQIDKAKLEEQYTARLDAYLNLRTKLCHIETTYNEERSPALWQSDERKPMIDLIRTVAMMLPTKTTFDSKDKQQGIKEIAVSHAILLGLCAYVSMRIHTKEYKAEGKGLFKKAVSIVHSNPKCSTLYTLLDEKIKRYRADAKADCIDELHKHLAKIGDDAGIIYPDKLQKAGTLRDIKTYQAKLLTESSKDAAQSHAYR